MHYYTSILIFLLVLGGVHLQAQTAVDTLSLDQFLRLADEKAIDGEAAKLSMMEADLSYAIFQSRLKPRLVATANLPNFTKTSSEIVQPNGTVLFQPVSNNNSALGLSLSQNIPQTGGTLFVRSDLQRFDDFENDATLYNGIPIRIGLSQPLFGFNQLKWDKKLEPLKLREAQKKYIYDRELVHIEATRLFFSLLIARMDLDIANSNRSSNQALYDIAKERHALGKISDSDLIQLEVGLISAQKDQRSAEQAVRLASSQVYAFLGLAHRGELIFPLAPEMETNLEVDPDFAMQQALSNRFEQDSYARTLMEADQDVAQAKGEGGFQASIFASFGLTRSAMEVGDIYQAPQQEQLFQLQLSVPILDWGRQRSLVKIAGARKDYAQKWVSQEKTRFQTEVQQAVDAFTNIQQELTLARKLQELATNRFKISEESFVLGAISITDLTLSQREKDQTQRSYIATLSLYWRYYYQLRLLTLYDFANKQPIQ